jgi:16S rRNA (uracil1498-N3)-methyltransferase
VRLTRVHVGEPLATETDLQLPEAAAYHVARVLRLREGAAILAFDGSGSEYRCEILTVTGDRVLVRVGAKAAGLPESPLRITLVQAVSRGERMD